MEGMWKIGIFRSIFRFILKTVQDTAGAFALGGSSLAAYVRGLWTVVYGGLLP